MRATSWITAIAASFALTLAVSAVRAAESSLDFSRGGTALVVVEVERPAAWSHLDGDALRAMTVTQYRERAAELRDSTLRILADAPSGQVRVVEALGNSPLVLLEVTPAGLEHVSSLARVRGVHAYRPRRASSSGLGRLSSISTEHRSRIEKALKERGRAAVIVQLRPVPLRESETASGSRSVRRERRDRAVLDRLPAGATRVERSLGADHRLLSVDAAGFAALLRDPDVVAIAAAP